MNSRTVSSPIMSKLHYFLRFYFPSRTNSFHLHQKRWIVFDMINISRLSCAGRSVFRLGYFVPFFGTPLCRYQTLNLVNHPFQLFHLDLGLFLPCKFYQWEQLLIHYCVNYFFMGHVQVMKEKMPFLISNKTFFVESLSFQRRFFVVSRLSTSSWFDMISLDLTDITRFLLTRLSVLKK